MCADVISWMVGERDPAVAVVKAARRRSRRADWAVGLSVRYLRLQQMVVLVVSWPAKIKPKIYCNMC
jgi:hypothetical protein